MITYDSGICASLSSCSAVRAIFREDLFQKSLAISFLGGIFAWVIARYKDELDYARYCAGFQQMFASFLGLIGFLLIFRVSQAYQRFQTGSDLIFEMVADFADATSILVSMARGARCDKNYTKNFEGVIVRLVSLLTAVSFTGLAMEDVGNDSEEHLGAFLSKYGHITIDILGLDEGTLRTIARSQCKTELVYQLIQNAIVDHVGDVLTIPAPLLTRVFQEFGTGMIKYHEAFKLVHVPYPFPFIALLELALIFQWFFCPFMYATFSDSPVGSAMFIVLTEFILWSMLGVASEFDNPFGSDTNDIDAGKLQQHLNHTLASLLEHSDAPCTTLCDRRAEVVTTSFYKHESDSAPHDGIVRMGSGGLHLRTLSQMPEDFMAKVNSITRINSLHRNEQRSDWSLIRLEELKAECVAPRQSWGHAPQTARASTSELQWDDALQGSSSEGHDAPACPTDIDAGIGMATRSSTRVGGSSSCLASTGQDEHRQRGTDWPRGRQSCDWPRADHALAKTCTDREDNVPIPSLKANATLQNGGHDEHNETLQYSIMKGRDESGRAIAFI